MKKKICTVNVNNFQVETDNKSLVIIMMMINRSGKKEIITK